MVRATVVFLQLIQTPAALLLAWVHGIDVNAIPAVVVAVLFQIIVRLVIHNVVGYRGILPNAVLLSDLHHGMVVGVEVHMHPMFPMDVLLQKVTVVRTVLHLKNVAQYLVLNILMAPTVVIRHLGIQLVNF